MFNENNNLEVKEERYPSLPARKVDQSQQKNEADDDDNDDSDGFKLNKKEIFIGEEDEEEKSDGYYNQLMKPVKNVLDSYSGNESFNNEKIDSSMNESQKSKQKKSAEIQTQTDELPETLEIPQGINRKDYMDDRIVVIKDPITVNDG